MDRPSFLDRHPSFALFALLVLWFGIGILEGLGL
jgi:ABC-type proline/glycine betaine transport system permease subunit